MTILIKSLIFLPATMTQHVVHPLIVGEVQLITMHS